MRRLRASVVLLVVAAFLVVPMLAACSSNASTTSAPAAKATEAPKAAPTTAAAATKPAAEATQPAAAAKPAGQAPSGAPIKIGLVDSFSGYSSAMGTPQREAILALADQVNAEGGINGHPLQIIAYDDETDSSKSVLAVKKLIEQDKVVGILGPCNTGMAMSDVPIVEAAKVPIITLNSSAAVLKPPAKYIFKLPLSEAFYVEGMFTYMKDQNLTKIGLLTQGDGFGKEAKKYFDDNAAKKGFKIVADESYGPNDTDITAPLTKIKATNPDVLVIYGAGPAGAIGVRQAKELGFKVPIIIPDSLTMAAIMNVKELRDGLEGAIVAGHKPDVFKQLPDTDKQKKIITDLDNLMQQKYHHPVSMWESNAYDVFTMMVNAAKKANVDPTNLQAARDKLRDAIEATKDFVGAANIVSYSPTQHEIVRMDTLAINTIKDGQFKLVKTYNQP